MMVYCSSCCGVQKWTFSGIFFTKRFNPLQTI